MARELKFRAWNSELDEMVYEGGTFPNCIHSHTILHGYSEEEIMQYTGLKDRNGKEIYEGDILCRRTGQTQELDMDYAFEVKWENGAFIAYTGQRLYAFMRPNRITENTAWEVIGNIYQHPELLTS